MLEHGDLKNVLPKELGGCDGTLAEWADLWKKCLTNDEDFQKKRDTWILSGQLPVEKRKLFSFEENDMSGSFRKLQID